MENPDPTKDEMIQELTCLYESLSELEKVAICEVLDEIESVGEFLEPG